MYDDTYHILCTHQHIYDSTKFVQRDYVTEHQRNKLKEDKKKNSQNIVTTQDIKAIVTSIKPCPQQLPQRFVNGNYYNVHYY